MVALLAIHACLDFSFSTPTQFTALFEGIHLLLSALPLSNVGSKYVNLTPLLKKLKFHRSEPPVSADRRSWLRSISLIYNNTIETKRNQELGIEVPDWI